MKLFSTVTIVLGATTFASGQTVIMDQIGSMDGSDIASGITGCQDFESAYDIYDIVTADSFTGNGDTISMVEMVLNGWNGFTDPSSVTAYTANIYTDENAAANSLTGDIATEIIDAADATQSPDWTGDGFLISVNTSITDSVGVQLRPCKCSCMNLS